VKVLRAETKGAAVSPDVAPSRIGHAGLIAAALAFLVYLPSIAGPFLYDDVRTVIDNRSLESLWTPGALITLLRYDRARPVLNFTWALNRILSGREPWSYHLVNILVHAANAALVASLFAWIARRHGGVPRPRETALLGACLFAVSPMAAETVAYVSSRSSSLSALFALASLRLAVEAFDRPRKSTVAGSLALLILALGTKEEAACAPLLLLLIDFFFVSGQRLAPVAARWRLHVPYFGLLILGLFGRRFSTGSWLPAGEMDRFQFAVLEWAAFPEYLLRQLLPFDPALFRGHGADWPPGPGTWALLALSTIVIVAAVVGRRRWPIAAFAVAWLFCALLPSSSLVPLGELVVDHRAYLGSAGITFFVATLLVGFVRPRGVWIAILVLLAARSFHYEWVLADPVRAFEDAQRRFPRSGALRLLAEAQEAAGDAAAAERELLQSLAEEPRDARTWTNLGILYARTGRYANAATALQQAAPLARPADVSQIQDNLGMILLHLGREDEAVGAFEASVAADPNRAQPRISLAQILLKRGDRARARVLLDEAVRAPEITPEEATWVERLRRQT
jgi:hypothetical protein